MREYLMRAGIIGTTNSTNGTFGQRSTDGILGPIDHSQNEKMKSQLGENFNRTWTVRIWSFIWLSLQILDDQTMHCLVFQYLFPWTIGTG